LRPVRADDLWLLQAQGDEQEAGGPYNWSGYRSPVVIEQAYAADGFLGPDGGRLIVVAADEPAGTVSWRRVSYGDDDWCAWNIGINVLPQFRGRGVGRRAQRLLVDYLFQTTPCHRIEAYTEVGNVAENRALAAIGFEKEGIVRAAQFRRGQWRDLALYSLLRPDL
jgi:RimJ/RimL family protein N-acetyltransferase